MLTRVSDSDPEMLRYLGERGIEPGTRLEVVGREPFGGPLNVRVGKRELPLGLGLARAMQRCELGALRDERDQAEREGEAAGVHEDAGAAVRDEDLHGCAHRASARRASARARFAGRLCEYAARVALADDFQAIVDSLPPDWTHLQFDLRIDDEERYIEAATILVQINAQGYCEARLALACARRARVRPCGRGARPCTAR